MLQNTGRRGRGQGWSCVGWGRGNRKRSVVNGNIILDNGLAPDRRQPLPKAC